MTTAIRRRLLWLVAAILVVQSTACARGGIVAGYHAGSPAWLSVAAGPALLLRSDSVTLGDSLHRRSYRRERKVFALAEPGWKGGRLSMGYGTEAKSGSTGRIMSIRGTMYRRWESDRRDPGGTFAGLEVSAGGIGETLGGIRFGFLSRVAGPIGRRGTLFTIDLPIGW